jgi:hypothetical protein
MTEKRKKHTSNTRQYASEQEILTVGASRQRRMRRIGSTSERKPLPVITPRPRSEQAAQPSTRTRREKRVSKSAASAPGMPPVMARGGMESMASRRPSRKPPKRRFDIALSALAAEAPGAEVRLPALPRLQFSWRIVSGGIVLLLLACLFMIWQSPTFRISDVQAVGLQRLTVADLTSSLGVLGDSVFLVSSKELEESLQSLYPELADVDVKISIPGALTITANERQPVLAWTQDDTELWVDEEGVSFLPRGNPTAPLVRVKAQSAPPGSLPDPVKASNTASLEELLAATPASSAPQLRLDPQLVSIILALNTIVPPDTLLLYNTEHGLGWNDKQHGWKVFFGSDTQNIDQKLMVYQAIAERLESDGIQPVLVSVEFLHAPYYRMER